MASAGVVEAFDVPEDAHACVLACGEAFAFEEFFLEAGEECLGERVVPGVADAAHGEIDSRLLGMAAVGRARILGAVIGVRDDAAVSRVWAAMPSASRTSSVLRSSRIDQPMILRL